MSDVLSSELSDATTTQNTANEPTKIVEWDTPTGVIRRIREGHPAVLTVDDGAADLPRDSRLALGLREPNDPLDSYKFLFAEFDISPFNDLTLSQQRSNENAEERRVRFNDQAPEGFVQVNEADFLELWLLSSATIDTGSLIFEYPMREQNR